MKFVSKRYLIKIPSEIDVLYCEKNKTLVIKTSFFTKLVILKVKVLIIKEKNVIVVTNLPFSKTSNKLRKRFKSLQGTTAALIKKALHEVSSVTFKKLKLIGVGYKVFESKTLTTNTKLLHFKLGYSHSIYYKIPDDVLIKSRQSTKLFISGYDFDKVSQVTAILKSCKLPEPYKGKGILNSGEIIQLKDGKKV
jgi:large subunit ribosomal protein L6